MSAVTKAYFAPHQAAWAKIFRSLGWDAEAKKTAVEIGSYEGGSAFWIVRNLLRHPDSRLFCIDAWEGASMQPVHAQFIANIAELPDAEKVTVLRARSAAALLDLAHRQVRADLVYVDGSHAAADVLSDMVLAFHLLCVGGVMICDDYLWQDHRYDGGTVLGRPKISIDAFTTIHADKIAWLEGTPNVQVAFRKEAD